jgi:hypothetical protein
MILLLYIFLSKTDTSSHKQFEDAKGVLRSCNSKKDRQYSDQKKDRQYSDQKKDRQYSDQKTDNTGSLVSVEVILFFTRIVPL